MMINMSFDTETKEFNATINGQSLTNVRYMSLYKDYDDPTKSHIDINMEQDMGEGVIVYTSVTAKEGTKNINEFPIVEKDKIVAGAYALMCEKPPK